MPHKVWVRVSGEKDYVSNNMTFPTEEKAKEYGEDLFMRWTAIDKWYVKEEEKDGATTDPSKGSE